MRFVAFLKDIVFKIDSSENTNKVLTILQALAAASIGIYTIYVESQPDIAKLSIYTFWIFQTIFLLYFVGMLIISEKYRAIKWDQSRFGALIFYPRSPVTLVKPSVDYPDY